MDLDYYVAKGLATYWLGGKIGELAVTLGAASGIPGAIIGAIAGIVVDAVFQYFKENIVSWIYDAIDAFREWISGPSQGLANA